MSSPVSGSFGGSNSKVHVNRDIGLEDRRTVPIPKYTQPTSANKSPASGLNGSGTNTNLLMEKIEANRAALQQLYALNAPVFQEFSGQTNSKDHVQTASSTASTKLKSDSGSGMKSNAKEKLSTGSSRGGSPSFISHRSEHGKHYKQESNENNGTPPVTMSYYDSYQPTQTMNVNANDSNNNSSGNVNNKEVYTKYYQLSKSKALQDWYEKQRLHGVKQ